MNKLTEEFDFSQPIEFSKLGSEPNLEVKLKKQKSQTIDSQKKASDPKNQQVLVIVFILLVGLIAAGSFSIIQALRVQELENELNPGPEVAGVSNTDQGNNIIVGSGFSIIMDQPTPESFNLKTNFGSVNFLSKVGSTTQFLAQLEKGGLDLTTGIEVQIAEYDNKLDADQFIEEIDSTLGSSYTLGSEQIKVSDQFELAKFVSQSQDDPTYYATVTTENYYLIKIYNQTSEYSEFIDYSRFTDNLIPNLWLN